MPIGTLLVLGLAAGAVGVALGRMVFATLRYRGERLITCPENCRPAGVRVDARHAAATALGNPELRLSHCSRWPERAGCGQECLSQIATAPADCLVRNIAERWYRGKICASCGRPIGEIQWNVSQPALLRAGGQSLEWSRVPADQLYDVLAASAPLCFACHTANAFVRERPELAIGAVEAGRTVHATPGK
ncbi:MAG TPA: hypothetical protein VGF59_25485 [Bryobacteraceae bacterium]|jgi:hypothetical protein